MMKKLLIFCFMSLCLFTFQVHSQTKSVIDSKALGLFCHDLFDLGEYGFVLMYNKHKEDISGTTKINNVQQNFFYYSRDLQKKAAFKMVANGELTMMANKNYILVNDREVNIYNLRLMDYIGREWASKKVDLSEIGLSHAQIERSWITPNNRMLLEVIDSRGETHLYELDLLNKNQNYFVELDFPASSNNPLINMKSKGNWTFLSAYSGFYLFYKRGSNAEYEPTSLSYHLSFYDEQFSLFRELLIDNILQPGENLFGKEATVAINPALQLFVVSAIIKKNGVSHLLISGYGMDPNSSVMTQFWRHTLPIVNMKNYRLISEDGVTMPLPPVVRVNGTRTEVSVVKSRTSVEEEALNQLVCLDAQGKISFNQLQMGNYDQLNLDNFCVDNNNMYSRIKQLQMNPILKQACEKPSISVLDFYLSDKGDELAILKDDKEKQVIVYSFKGKE